MYELWFKIEVWQLAPKHNECYFGGIKYILDASPTYHNATGLCIGKHLIPIRPPSLCLWVMCNSVFVSGLQFCACEWCGILCLWVLYDSVFVSDVGFCVCECCGILCLWVTWDSVFVSVVRFCVWIQTWNLYFIIQLAISKYIISIFQADRYNLSCNLKWLLILLQVQ